MFTSFDDIFYHEFARRCILEIGLVLSVMHHCDFITFQPFYGGKINKITSEVRNPGGEIVCKVVGEWNGALEYTYANVSVI